MSIKSLTEMGEYNDFEKDQIQKILDEEQKLLKDGQNFQVYLSDDGSKISKADDNNEGDKIDEIRDSSLIEIGVITTIE